MIVRDEAHCLGRCLEHVRAFTDSIVVVDTGSSDDSIAIANQWGATVIRSEWRNDFAAARNIALDHAPSDWILYIDADEVLHGSPEQLSRLDCEDIVAATVLFQASSRLTLYAEHRLFRNRPDIRFRSVIHETIVPDLGRIVREEGLRIVPTELRIEHHGYEGDLGAKHRRNHPLLLRAIEDDPRRVYLWHALGECELGLGRAHAALTAFCEGLAVCRTRSAEPIDALIYSSLVGMHFEQGRSGRPKAQKLLKEGLAACPADPLLVWWRARLAAADGDLDGARAAAQSLLDRKPDEEPTGPLSYERLLFSAWPRGLIGSCLLAQGRTDEAQQWLSEALAEDAENQELKAKLSLAQGRLQPA